MAGIAAAGAAVVAALALAIWANVAIRSQAKDAIHARPEDTPARPIAIVFGARVWRSGPSHILEDRLEAAVRLYELNKVRKLLLSGDHGQDDYDEVNAMKKYAEGRGVRAEDIFLDHAGFRTYDTLYRARDVFGVTEAILVTNEFHLPRAIYTAQRFGLHVVGLKSDTRIYKTHLWNNVRESLARTLAWVQVNITRPRPRYLGPRINIGGDGRVTHDY